MRTSLWLLFACRACEPQLPSTNNPDPEDSNKEDSTEDSPNESHSDSPIDTSPPVFCDIVETEPNGQTEPMTLPTNKWICGKIDILADSDWFSVTTTEPGWITLQVEAASRGSSADMMLLVEDGSRSANVVDAYLSTDPRISFPVTANTTYGGYVSESNQLLYGEDYTWYLRAYIDKAPLGWSLEETEPNGPVQTDAQELPTNERVFGTISDSEDQDWYHITTPEGATALIFDVDAFEYGSPANTTLVIRDLEGDIVKWQTNGEIDYNPDPHYELKIETPHEYYLQVFNPSQEGSQFHWYTLSVMVEY